MGVDEVESSWAGLYKSITVSRVSCVQMYKKQILAALLPDVVLKITNYTISIAITSIRNYRQITFRREHILNNIFISSNHTTLEFTLIVEDSGSC